mmetsp:Transcript_24042/g.77595  ORF Transcript_24042/g.77595 Transcript_24042/m.77595 type:complete len:201 (-) Transcript_24042:1096-1698(-)
MGGLLRPGLLPLPLSASHHGLVPPPPDGRFPIPVCLLLLLEPLQLLLRRRLGWAGRTFHHRRPKLGYPAVQLHAAARSAAITWIGTTAGLRPIAAARYRPRRAPEPPRARRVRMQPPCVTRNQPADPNRLGWCPNKVGSLLIPSRLEERLKLTRHGLVHQPLRGLPRAPHPPHQLVVARSQLRRLFKLARTHQSADRLHP